METILDKSLILFRYLQDKVDIDVGRGGEREGEGEAVREQLCVHAVLEGGVY